MSSLIFPYFTSGSTTGSLPGISAEVAEPLSYPSTVHRSRGGKEQRTSWSSSPDIAYHVKCSMLRTFVAAPPPYDSTGSWGAAMSELGVVRYFYDAHLGDWDSFYFQDPSDGVSRKVRFDGELETERVAEGFWTAEFELRTVR